jgi:hypothetical protein
MYRRIIGATLLTAALALPGCTSSPDEPAAAPTTTPRPTGAHLDLSRLPVHRSEFCHVLGRDDVAQALGGSVLATGHYGNGQEAELSPGYVDVAHEYACVYEGIGGSTARTWVFARPVEAAEARALVRLERRREDCAYPQSVRFGTPGLTSVCEVPGETAGEPVQFRARLSGLFGDTWVGCEVTEPLGRATAAVHRGDVVQRAEQWCTEVVTAMSARPEP